jgi:tripartite-type tricarboxylate transporter receptor subunit TctC
MLNRRQVLHTTVAASLASAGISVRAQAWPNQALKIIVPFPAGGTSDVIARVMQNPLSELLKTVVVVENRTGANGMVGAGAVASSTDAHSLLLSDMSSVAVAPVLIKDLAFKPADLQGVTMLAYSPHMLLATLSLVFLLNSTISFRLLKGKDGVATSMCGEYASMVTPCKSVVL